MSMSTFYNSNLCEITRNTISCVHRCLHVLQVLVWPSSSTRRFCQCCLARPSGPCFSFSCLFSWVWTRRYLALCILAYWFRVSKGREKTKRTHVMHLLFASPQFVCVESLATAITDLFPRTLRRPGAREILVLVIAAVCFLLGLPLVTEVREQEGGLSD